MVSALVPDPNPTECPVDIVFVLDASDSIGTSDFNLMKSYVSRLVSGLDIDGGKTRVGLVTYSLNVTTSISLNAHSTLAGVLSAISSLSYSGGNTNTAAALAFVRTRMLTSAAGDRSNGPNIVVVLTRGRSIDTSATKVSIMWKLLHKTSTFQKQKRSSAHSISDNCVVVQK